MKKRLLTLGAIALTLSVNAQFITYVGNNANVYVKKNALVYNGGGVKTVGAGLVDNSGNIMVVGNATSKFVTVQADGSDKKDGGNFILRMTDENLNNLRYGQLYITGLEQANITGIVDKQYKDVAHGTYQQVALPFNAKVFSTLSDELGKSFSGDRWSQNEVLVWNNAKAVFEGLKINQGTEATEALVGGLKPRVAYYAIGAKGFNPSLAVKTVKGVPYADGFIETLHNAGKDIPFGDGGSNINHYREEYNSYLQDAFDGNTPWKGNYGRNLYLIGNPFLTNIDLKHVHHQIANIQGIRIKMGGVVTDKDGATYTDSYVPDQYITYNSGVPTGDNKNMIIAPMQVFALKLANNDSAKQLNIDDLRRFTYVSNTTYKQDAGVTTMAKGDSSTSLRTMSKASKSLLTSNTVKQLAVVALDAKGEELGRTYYVVYANGVSGQPEKVSTQVIAGKNVIGTFEESKEGGLDNDLKNTYWLYINEANENDFKGKEIPMRLYSKDIKSLKFEIQENANDIAEGQEKLSTGESFYINTGGKVVALGNGKSIAIPSTEAEFGLYYGKPSSVDKVIENEAVARPSSTFVVFDNSVDAYKLIFDSSWKTASVNVYDMAGRIILSQDNVNAANHFTLNLPSGRGTYVVTAISELGHKFSQKIIK